MILPVTQYKGPVTNPRGFQGILHPEPNIGSDPKGSKAAGASETRQSTFPEAGNFSEFSKFWLFPCRFFYLTA